MSQTLYVGNLHYRTTSTDLEELFSEVGLVKSVRLPQDLDGRSKQDAAEAIQHFNGRVVAGRALQVKDANRG